MPPRRAATGPKKKIVKTVRATRRSVAAAAALEESPTPGTAAETPTDETPAAAEAADDTIVTDEAATGSPPHPAAPEDQAAATGARQTDPAPEASAAEEEAVGSADAAPPETCVAEPAGAPGTNAEVAEAAPAKKTTKKVVRKVTRRVPVRRMPNKAAPAAVKADKGGEGGEEMVALASTEAELNSGAAEAASISVEEQTLREAEAISIQAEGQSSKEGEAVSIQVEEQTSIGGGVVSVSVDGQNTVSCPNHSPAVEEPIAHVEAAVSAAAASADGATPVVASQRMVRKVKRIVIVKRPAKRAESSQKEKKTEEADRGAEEKVGNTGDDVNYNESSKNNEAGTEVGAGSAPGGSPEMVDNSENGHAGRSVEAEQEKVEGEGTVSGIGGDQVVGVGERQKRRKTEIFIGGLDRNAMEDDIRKVFGKVGEIVEVRMMMDGKTGKNKGYAFLRYATAAQAKQAVTEFTKVEVCGKQCGAAALEGNDTIFLGNIDKKWKKDDVIKLLHDIGIEKIDTVTLMSDPRNPDCNRGFAFLDFETNRDAQIAFKKLEKKDAFGKGQNVKVAWAEPLNDPDEEEMQKVKSVFVEGIPYSWDENKVRECFRRFGQIERVVLSRNMHSAKRKDFAFVNFATREAALSCIESFDEDLINSDSKVSLRVSLAKPVHKHKPNKPAMKSGDKDNSKVKPKAVQRDKKVNVSVNNQSSKGACSNVGGAKTSTTHELLHVLREQASWKQVSFPRGPAVPDDSVGLHGGKRPLSALGADPLYADPGRYPHARLDRAYQGANPSYSSLSHSMAGTSLEYYRQSTVGYGTGSAYGAVDVSRPLKMRPGSAPYGSGLHSR